MFVIRMFTDARPYTFVLVEGLTELCARADLRMRVHKPVMFFLSPPFRSYEHINVSVCACACAADVITWRYTDARSYTNASFVFKP
jgi:hypothetical protein